MSAELTPSSVDWPAVWETMGKDPCESFDGQAKLAAAVSFSDEVPIDDEQEAAEFVMDAVEQDGLAREDDGYVIKAQYNSEDDTELPDQTDTAEPEAAETSADVSELRAEIEELRAQVRRQDRIITMLLGEDLSLGEVSPADMRPMLARLQSLEDRMADVETEIQQQSEVTDQTQSKPDERAQKLRQALLNHADDDGHAALTRDKVDAILGGLHRGSVLDAMKRAADGHRASDVDRPYSPIDGASDLTPVDAITFEVSGGTDDQSRIVLDGDNLTGSDLRQNLMTEEER